MSSRIAAPDIFDYISGQFLFNEDIRLAERHVSFNVNALAEAVCRSVKRPASELVSISKLAEGGLNRILQVMFKDDYSVIARIPYKSTVPKCRAVASEAATLDWLFSHGIPVPKVLGYSHTPANPVGTEYLLLEKLEGTPLSDQWFTVDNKTRTKVMRQIVDIEKRFMSLSFPASGSLYYREDLQEADPFIPISASQNQIVVGPSTQFEWWYRERAVLENHRGPWETFQSCFEAPAKREIDFCQQFAKPRLHVQRYLRELYNFKEISPALHVALLSKYLELAPHLNITSTHRFSRPVLRHPDFSPNNILVDSSNDIVGIIDWQNAVILPLCLCAGIPDHFQNWGDPISETLQKPDVKLPDDDDFHKLSGNEQESIRETMRRRLVHFYYAALTMKQMPDHFDALRTDNVILRAKLFAYAGAPWEGDSLSLKYAMLQVYRNWPMAIDTVTPTPPPTQSTPCPVRYTEDEMIQCKDEYNQEQEKLQELTEMKNVIGIDSLGWVPDDEHLERSREIAKAVKEGLLEYSQSEVERIAVREHFPFDDHEEDG